MNTLIGTGMITGSTLLYWLALPKKGKETWLVGLPGSWIALPLIILLGTLVGGMLVYANLFM